VRASTPPLTILGSLGGVEAGIRQMRRVRPLETTTFEIAAKTRVVMPTRDEILRVKAYLIGQRNYVRDYLDVVALTETVGVTHAVEVLREIDNYYVDRSGEPGSVLTALVARLADPSPLDTDVIDELPRYKGLKRRWHEWAVVKDECRILAEGLAGLNDLDGGGARRQRPAKQGRT
jgi:hypothetical protein